MSYDEDFDVMFDRVYPVYENRIERLNKWKELLPGTDVKVKSQSDIELLEILKKVGFSTL